MRPQFVIPSEAEKQGLSLSVILAHARIQNFSLCKEREKKRHWIPDYKRRE